MERDLVNKKLLELDRALFGERRTTLLAQYSAPFDISRPNIHDNKTEFLREFETVKTVLAHCEAIIANFAAPSGDISPEHEAMTNRLAIAINVSGLGDRARRSVYTANDLLMRNTVDTGLQHNFLNVVSITKNAYRERLQELTRQEELFWSVSHRPPNYYARTIALRFAKHFAKERGEKPTFGTVSDGNHPSTDYGRALEEIFKILIIKANVRKAAEWAIGQLTDEDWRPAPPIGLTRFFDGLPDETSD